MKPYNGYLPGYTAKHLKRISRYSVGEIKASIKGDLQLARMFRQAINGCRRVHNL